MSPEEEVDRSDLTIVPAPICWLVLEGEYSPGEEIDRLELFELVGFSGCDAFDAKAGKPVDCTVETNSALDVALVSIVRTADGVPRSAVAGMEIFRRGGEVLIPVDTVDAFRPNLTCDAFDARAGELVDCPIETETALEFSLIMVVRAADCVFPTCKLGTDRLLEGNEVLMPVPVVKELWPNLILKTPSVVEFWGPLPILKSISFEPHCLTYVASLATADE